MSKVFGVYFQMHDEKGVYHAFVPGDEVPTWAESRVGDHVLADGQKADSKPEPEPDTGTEKGKEDGDAAAEPDFTKPATKGRRKSAKG